MKIVIFGLSVSSSWGNGHATLWRGLFAAMATRAYEVVFFEKDVPYYREHRDLRVIPSGSLVLYESWDQIRYLAEEQVRHADVALITSFCPDALPATELVIEKCRGIRAFYDLDSGVSLERLAAGEPVEYYGPRGLQDFDLALSYTGGAALDELRLRLGAPVVEPLYGSVDPEVHHPVDAQPDLISDLSYLGTYAGDRQAVLEQLLLQPAQRLPGMRFRMGGSLYPQDFPWLENLYFSRHVEPRLHPAFYCSSRATLNATRLAMAKRGYCPSGRLFEAAACGVPILTDDWEGLNLFFEPGREVLVCRDSQDVVDALMLPPDDLAAIGKRARERTLTEHTASHRLDEFERILSAVGIPFRRGAVAQTRLHFARDAARTRAVTRHTGRWPFF